MQGRRRGGVLAAVLLVGSLAACDAVGQVSGPDPQDAAVRLATALASGTFTEVRFTDATPADVTKAYAEVVDQMGDLEPSVTAGEVEESGDTATAPSPGAGRSPARSGATTPRRC